MKTKTITIEGFTSDLSPDDKASLSIHGVEGVGKTRLAMTAPDPIGLLPLDKKSKRTAEAIGAELGKRIIAPTKPFITDLDAMKIAMLPEESEDSKIREANERTTKQIYRDAYSKAGEAAMKLASHPDIQTIVVDTNTQLWDWIVFKNFGRKNQIAPTSRSVPNQDMIDFINALRGKHLILIHRSKEIWKNTGKTDKRGEPIKEPSGKFEVEGFNKIGGFVTATIELTNKKTPTTNLDSKFKVKVVTCQTKPLLEGQELDEYEIKGDTITWDNLAAVMGF